MKWNLCCEGADFRFISRTSKSLEDTITHCLTYKPGISLRIVDFRQNYFSLEDDVVAEGQDFNLMNLRRIYLSHYFELISESNQNGRIEMSLLSFVSFPVISSPNHSCSTGQLIRRKNTSTPSLACIGFRHQYLSSSIITHVCTLHCPCDGHTCSDA